MRRVALAGLLAALCACGGPSTPKAAPTTPTPSRTTAKPSPKPTTKPTPKPTTPSPTVTTPPPVTGSVVTIANASLRPVTDGPAPVHVAAGADCATIFPDLADASCGAVKLAGGDVLWGFGLADDVGTVRVLTLDTAAKGYVLRYEGHEGGTAWSGVKAFGAALTGQGTDGLVVVVRLASGAASYDVLTWVPGGPLVLRAHRGPLSDGRLAPDKGVLLEYALVPDGRYARRTLAWDGRYFRISAPTGVPASKAPPA